MKTTTILAIIAACGAAPLTTLAGNVDITKNRDSHITVYNTFFGSRYGDPVYDGTLPAGHRLQLSEGWFTDLSVVQDPLAVGLHQTTTGFAMVTGSPGNYTMSDLTQAVGSLAGTGRIGAADLASSFFDVFVTVDLDDYVMGGGVAPPVGTSLDVVNGHCAALPGFTVGLSAFVFEPASGWTTSAPFTGQVSVIGDMGLAVPTPGTLALASLGGLLLSRRRR